MTVEIASSGYLQSIDLDELMEIASGQKVVIEIVIKPEDQLVKGQKVGRERTPGETISRES